MNLFLFPKESLQAALLVSLMSVSVLVGLFYYLNRYTKRRYFTTWTAAWLFHACWLALELCLPERSEITSMLKISCVAMCALFLLWGSLDFLEISVNQRTFGFFLLFLVVWTFSNPASRVGSVEAQLPVFILLGAGSIFAAASFYRFRCRKPFVGAGMLALGFLLWGLHLGTYPLTHHDPGLRSAAVFLAAILQLFIAVSMIVLVLEEVRHKSEQALREVAVVRSQKEELELKVLNVEEQCRELYGQVRDISGLQSAYQELRQRQKAVVQQERLRALGEMASGIGHDVNNALSPIMVYSEMLQREIVDLPESGRNKLNIICRRAKDIADIVSRMRNFYRTSDETDRLESVDVPKLIEEVVEFTKPRWRDLPLRKGISIQVEANPEPDLPPLSCNPSDLREALTNLIFNAVDAMPRGGLISVVTRMVESEETSRTGKQLQIEVQDTGDGMEEETRQRCLEPFFTTKGSSGGTGLGLAMVYGMVQRHHGTIDIESTAKAGTCIRITLPSRTISSQPTAQAEKILTLRRSLRLLCVDDDSELREMLHASLSGLNHTVTLAEDGKRALVLFSDALRNKSPYEAVITDLGMPGVNGLQIAQAVKEESPSTPVIMLTGWAEMMMGNKDAKQHVDAVLAKPHSMVELDNLLQALVQLSSPACHESNDRSLHSKPSPTPADHETHAGSHVESFFITRQTPLNA